MPTTEFYPFGRPGSILFRLPWWTWWSLVELNRPVEEAGGNDLQVEGEFPASNNLSPREAGIYTVPGMAEPSDGGFPTTVWQIYARTQMVRFDDDGPVGGFRSGSDR